MDCIIFLLLTKGATKNFKMGMKDKSKTELLQTYINLMNLFYHIQFKYTKQYEYWNL